MCPDPDAQPLNDVAAPPTREVLAFPRDDKWNHRRGEPRVFALLWTCYLLLTTVIGFARLGQAPLDVLQYRPSARMMLVSVALGITVLWPMLRLSQVKPAIGGILSCRRDLPIVLIPMQAMIWPQIWLGRWTVEQIGAAAAALCVWAILIGGVLAIALGKRQHTKTAMHRAEPARSPHWAWMLVFIAIAGCVPAMNMAHVLTDHQMLSPFTAMMHLTRDEWTSTGAMVAGSDWAQLGVVLFVGVLVWILAAVLPKPDPSSPSSPHPPRPRTPSIPHTSSQSSHDTSVASTAQTD